MKKIQDESAWGSWILVDLTWNDVTTRLWVSWQNAVAVTGGL